MQLFNSTRGFEARAWCQRVLESMLVANLNLEHVEDLDFDSALVYRSLSCNLASMDLQIKAEGLQKSYQTI